MSQGLAKMAAQQESIRRQLQGLADQIDKDGKNGNKGNLSKIMEDMEKTEKDIVNKNITEETLKRQQDILTRLLVAEKSERERDEDDKRESKEPKDSPLSNPSLFFEYNRKKLKETELLKTVPPALNLFYRTKVTDYFNNFENKQPVAPNPKTVPPAVAPLPGNGDKRNIKK
jgi:seryl-tRNA synthetase